MFGFFPFASAPFADAGSQSIEFGVTGVSANGFVGTVDLRISCIINPIGVYARGRVSRVLVWSRVVDDQTSDWQPVDDTQSGAWSPVADSQVSNWSLVSTSQSGTWVPVNDNSGTVWEDIPT